MEGRYILYALVAMVTWGGWAILANHALDYASPGPVIALTYISGFGITVLVHHEAVISAHSKWAIIFGVGAGLFMGIGTLFFYQALSSGGVSVAPAIAGLYFLVTTVYGAVVLGDSLSVLNIMGIILAVLAIFLLVQ